MQSKQQKKRYKREKREIRTKDEEREKGVQAQEGRDEGIFKSFTIKAFKRRTELLIDLILD